MNSEVTTSISLAHLEHQLDALQDRIFSNDLTEVEAILTQLSVDVELLKVEDQKGIKDKILDLSIQHVISAGAFEKLNDLINEHTAYSETTKIRICIAKGILASQSTDYRKSIFHFLTAEHLAMQVDNKRIHAQIQMNIGTVYAAVMHFQVAKEKYKDVLEKYIDVITEKTKGILLHNLGNLFYALGEYTKSANVLEQAIQLSKQAKNVHLVEMSQILLRRAKLAGSKTVNRSDLLNKKSSLYYVQLLSQAIQLENSDEEVLRRDLAKEALELAIGNKDYISQREAVNLIISSFKSQHDFENAFLWLNRLKDIESELKSIQETSRLIEQEVKFEIARKEAEITTLKKEQFLQKELVTRNEQLEVANEDLRQFAYVVSHDLKEPLRMIGSYTQLIKMSLKNDTTPDQSEYFDFVSGGVHRLNRLLDGLSNYSTLKSLQEEKSARSLESLVQEAIDNLDLLIQESKTTITVERSGTLAASPALFVLLLQNLIQNAIKFKKPDLAPEISIDFKREGDQNVIRIIDNGIGIPLNQQSRVFVIFQRLKRSASEGTGMGLAICKKIVQLHGGKINIDQSSSEGTVVKIELPN